MLLLSVDRTFSPKVRCNLTFKAGARMCQTLRSKVSFDSNTVDAIRNFPKNKSILLHDLEMA